MVFYIGNHGWICKRRDSNFGKLENFEEHNFHKITKNMHFMLTILKFIYVLSTLMPWIMEGEKLEHVGGGKCGNDDYIYKWEVLWSLIIYVYEVPRSLALNLFKTCTLLVSLFFVVETYFLIMIIWRRYLKVNLSFSLNVRVGLGAPSLPLHLPLG